jgi:high-affinity nickel-transport protein
VLYLLVFGTGTVVGMALITAAIALPLALTDRRSPRFATGLRVASGLLSAAFGAVLVYQIGFADGLFTGQPHWTPR